MKDEARGIPFSFSLVWLLCALVALLLVSLVSADEGVLKTDSRTPYVHRISLYNADGEVISPEDEPIPPYSAAGTCGKCHSYDSVSAGWHFNAADPKVDPGRPGEPWILTDLKTGTQLPISSRNWPGTHRPADVVLTPWQFVLTFGRHMPGGGLGDRFAEKPEDPKARWKISGKLEIDCLCCHSTDPKHDQTEWGKQIDEQNFKWAPVAADGLAVVRGSAKKLPDSYDPMLDADPASSGAGKGLKVIYDMKRFDADERIMFQIGERPVAGRCYFCHSTKLAGDEKAWESDPDVHLASGLTCADCHRNGLDHAMTRGVETEKAGGESSISTFSCRGCHESGRLGATALRHSGLPASHLEKLTCTACHSGPKPDGQVQSVRTSRAHGLGIASMHRRDDAPPYIVEPVLLKQADGRIAPHRTMWPAFWARTKGEAVSILAPDAVAQAAGEALGAKKTSEEEWKPLTEDQIAKTLEALSAKKDDAGEPAYVCNGKLYRRTAEGKLAASDHAAAEPYSWPLAHDVRPAGQSLGSGGCTDCHAAKAGFFFAQVASPSPAQIGEPKPKPMYELQGQKLADIRAWEKSARYRDAWVWTGLIAAAVLGLVLGNAVVISLGTILRAIVVRKPRRVE